LLMVMFLVFIKRGVVPMPWPPVVRILVAEGFMGAAILPMRDLPAPLTAPLGADVYLGVLLLLLPRSGLKRRVLDEALARRRRRRWGPLSGAAGCT
jgi:hypothetical protein